MNYFWVYFSYVFSPSNGWSMMIKYKQEKGLSYEVHLPSLGYPSPRLFASIATIPIGMNWEAVQEVSALFQWQTVSGDLGRQAWAQCALPAGPALLSSAISSLCTRPSVKELQGSCQRLVLSQPFVGHLWKEALPRHLLKLAKKNPTSTSLWVRRGRGGVETACYFLAPIRARSGLPP